MLIYAKNCRTALSYDLKSLDMRMQLYSGSTATSTSVDHPEIAESLNTCGDAYSSLGEYTTALAYYKKCLEMRKRLSATPNTPLLSNLLNCIGVTYDQLEQFEAALDYKKQALEMRLKYSRGDHRDVAASLNSVGVAYDRLSDYTRAIEFYTRSLDMRYRLLEKNGGAASGSRQSLLGSTPQRQSLKESSATERASGLMSSSSSLSGEELADKHIADLLYNLGVAHENLKNFALALEYHQKSLTIRRNMYPDELFKVADHTDIADSLKTIGNLFGKLNQPEKCLEYMLKSFEIKQRIYLKPHPDLIDCLNRLEIFSFIFKLFRNMTFCVCQVLVDRMRHWASTRKRSSIF